MNEEILKKLYESASSEFDMPSYEQFVLDMQDEAKLTLFRDSMSEVFDMPEIDQFKADLGFSKKKEDTESPSEDGSLDSQDSEFVKKFKSTGLATISNVARIPAFVQEQIVTLATAFDPQAREALNKMSFEERERALGMLANISGQAIAGTQLRDFSNELQTRSNEIAETFKQYDQSITDDILDLELGQATARIFAEVGGAIPSIIQAFIPVVGLASIGLGSAAAESRELQQEGEDLGLKTSATAALYGTAEAALETVTRGIGKRFFKSLAGKGDEFIKTSVKEFVKRTSKDFAAEGSSELGTELLQNLTDYAIQGDEEAFNKALGHYTDIFIIGGFATAPISGATQGAQVTRQTLEKRTINRQLENSKYDDLVSMFQDPTIDQDTESLAVDQTKKFLKFDLDQKVEQGELTRTEADQALKNYEDAVYIKNEFKGVEIPQENRSAVAALFLEKRDLKNKISGKDPVLVSKEIERFQQIDGEIKTLLEPAITTEEAVTIEETSEAAPEPVVTQPTPQRVSEVLNRPVTLTKLGGSNLDAPIEGDLYVEGQQVVLEDENGNLTEIGNVDEISESSLEELGIEIAEPNVKPMSDGNLMFQDKVLISDKKGIKKNKRGEISRVTLREQGGAFVTLRGANAEEAAYQILLKEATSPEQADFINQQLEQDEEFQNELRKVTEPTEAEATADTQQATKQAYIEELKRTKEEDPETYWTVSEVTPEVAKQGTLIDDQDGSAFVKDDGDIIGVFKKKTSKAKGVAQKLLKKAVEAGGVKLDNFDNYLTPIYKKAGFRVAGRVPFNEEYAPDGWKPEFGKPDVVAMVYDPNNELDIEERTFDDYDQMIEYRDSFLLDDQTRIDKESNDFLSSVGQQPLFQKEAAPTDQSEVEVITEEMNELSDERANFDVPSNLTTKAKTKIKSLVDRFGDKVKTIKDISVFNDVPFIFTISDQLTTGDFVNPVTGNTLKFFGGLGFNMTNETSAWANVTEAASKSTVKTAKEVYAKNKDLFERLWSEGKLPNGHVPMAVVKMGQNSIESNEAIFRVVSDNLKSKFSLRDRTAAKNNLLGQLKGKNANNRVIELVSKYKTIDEVLDNITEIPLGLRSEIGSFVFYGSPSLGAPTKPGTPNSPVLKSLLDGKDNSLRALFHLPTINNQIREEATKDIPDGHIISVVGVDVINSKVTSTQDGDFQHQNYDYGVKGELIGILENPVHAADVFPEMYSKSVYTFKENKKGKLPSPEVAVSQSVAASGAVAVTKAFRGAKVSTKMTTLDILLGKLRQAFPSVTVVNTQAEFDAVVNSPEVSKYSRNGDIIYGFTKDGKVFLNPKIATTNTAIHEYGHVWINFVEENNPALLQKGYDLLEGTDILKEKIKIHGNNKIARMEALADLIGNKGESIVNAGQKSKFKNWLNAMYTYIKSKFKAFSEMSADEFQDMTLNQFVDGVLSDLLSGREVTDKTVKSVEAVFQKVNSKDLIEKGIEGGFSKEAIRRGLEKLNVDLSDFDSQYSSLKEKYDSNVAKEKNLEIDDIYDRSQKAIQEKVKKKDLKYYRDITREKLLDRQTRIKNLLNGIGSKEAQRASNLLVTKAGASGYANFRVKQANKKIFDGLSEGDKVLLNKIIYARRVDAINENRKSRGLESYVGVEGYSQEAAKRNLKELKEALGKEKFNDLSSRATEYFKVFDQSLDRMLEAKLISKEVHEQLKNIEYSPIKTIKYLLPNDYDASQIDRMAQITGMSSSVIKSLSDENVNDIVLDAEWLLSTNVSMIEARVFENRLLNSFYDAVQGATSEEALAIEEYIKSNPIEGYTKEGKPKYKYDTAKVPVGYVRVPFIKDGNKVEMIVQEAYAKQLLDIKTKQGFLDETIPKLTGTNILRFFATSGNPLFIVGNTAVDFANILFLSDVYSNNKFFGGARLMYDSISKFLSKVGSSKGYQKTYEEFMLHGGSMDYLSSDGLKALESINPKNKYLESTKKAMQAWGRVLSYLGESSEIAFRLAVYDKSKENQLKDFKKVNGRDPNPQEMEDIMFAAARESRETIDFSQGGSAVKAADKALPYFNAATQGFRKAVDYANTNPKGFALSMVQGMTMSASFAAMSMFLLLKGMEDDDDLEEVLDSVSDYEKANYHIIFTGRKDENGEYEYVRIKKLPTISVFATLAEQMVLNAVLKQKGLKTDFDTDVLAKNLESAAPIVPTPKNLLSRNPLVSAIVTYTFNYDMFYDQEIFKGPMNKKIAASAEGAYDSRVDQIYKDLAPALGLSPKRTKAAIEKIVTSESTNPMIGLIYSGYDIVKSPFSEGVALDKELKSVIDRTMESTSKKLVRKTNKDLIRYKQEADVEAAKIEVDTEKYLAEQKMYSEIKKRYKKEKGEFTVKEYLDLIQENFEPADHAKYKKKYLAYIRNINSDPAILDIIYEDTPEIQAMMIFNKYGDALEQEEINDILTVYKASGRKISKKGLEIYQKKYQKR